MWKCAPGCSLNLLITSICVMEKLYVNWPLQLLWQFPQNHQVQYEYEYKSALILNFTFIFKMTVWFQFSLEEAIQWICSICAGCSKCGVSMWKRQAGSGDKGGGRGGERKTVVIKCIKRKCRRMQVVPVVLDEVLFSCWATKLFIYKTLTAFRYGRENCYTYHSFFLIARYLTVCYCTQSEVQDLFSPKILKCFQKQLTLSCGNWCSEPRGICLKKSG